MSKFDFNSLRKQVKQTNDLLRETFKASDAKLQAIAERGPEWHQANEERYKDPNYGKRVGQSISKTYSTEEGRAKQKAKSRPHTTEAKEKIRQANIGLKKSDDIKAKLSVKKIGNQNRCKSIVTPLGVFTSRKLAAEHYLANGRPNAMKWIERWLKEDSSNFYYISQEEYVMLTGKEIE